MEEKKFVSLTEFCAGHNIDFSFIDQLQQYGLIQTTAKEKLIVMDIDELPVLEKIVRMHYELDINLEGIETIIHLLNRVGDMHSEILSLQNRLRRYES